MFQDVLATDVIWAALNSRALGSTQGIVGSLEDLLLHRDQNLTDVVDTALGDCQQVLHVTDVVAGDGEASGPGIQLLREGHTCRVVASGVDPAAGREAELVKSELGIYVTQRVQSVECRNVGINTTEVGISHDKNPL